MIGRVADRPSTSHGPPVTSKVLSSSAADRPPTAHERPPAANQEDIDREEEGGRSCVVASEHREDDSPTTKPVRTSRFTRQLLVDSMDSGGSATAPGTLWPADSAENDTLERPSTSSGSLPQHPAASAAKVVEPMQTLRRGSRDGSFVSACLLSGCFCLPILTHRRARTHTSTHLYRQTHIRTHPLHLECALTPYCRSTIATFGCPGHRVSVAVYPLIHPATSFADGCGGAAIRTHACILLFCRCLARYSCHRYRYHHPHRRSCSQRSRGRAWRAGGCPRHCATAAG